MLVVTMLSPVIPAVAYFKLDDSVARFFVIGILCVLSVVCFTYIFGFTKHERMVVTEKAKGQLAKIFQNLRTHNDDKVSR